MVAVPLAGKNGTLGLIEAFSSKAYAFQDNSIRSLNLLAELILAAMKPEEEKRTAEALPQVPQLVIEPPVAIHAEEPVHTEQTVAEIKVEDVARHSAPEIAEPLLAPNFQIRRAEAEFSTGIKNCRWDRAFGGAGWNGSVVETTYCPDHDFTCR